jgi:uncharacterized protein
MPLIEQSDYRPPAYLWNGHLQTIVPALFRKVVVNYQRERIMTPDDDFLDLDWSLASGKSPAKKSSANQLVILSHGLEGDSTRQYITGMVRHLNNHGFDCLAWNFRSCSGEMNRQVRFYHSGATDDLEQVVTHAVAKGYRDISLIGFSLGGNLTLKFLGEQGAAIHPAVKRGVVFSVPMDLAASTATISRGFSRVYLQRFLKHLRLKVAGKEKLFPEKVSTKGYQQLRTFVDFDDRYTAPLHGFKDALDYYTRNSSIHFLNTISVPTLIINAKNDPMLASECFPEKLAQQLTHVWMEFPKEGGHCGFAPSDSNSEVYWSEERALQFLTKTH